MTKRKPSILFLCVANSARSQMAEGLARFLFGEDASIASAGSRPSGTVHPMAVTALQEIGIDISSHTSKTVDSLDSNFRDQLDFAITLCAEEECPIVISKAEKLHWPLPDPACLKNKDSLSEFRRVRDEIQKKLLLFQGELDPRKKIGV